VSKRLLDRGNCALGMELFGVYFHWNLDLFVLFPQIESCIGHLQNVLLRYPDGDVVYLRGVSFLLDKGRAL